MAEPVYRLKIEFIEKLEITMKGFQTINLGKMKWEREREHFLIHGSHQTVGWIACQCSTCMKHFWKCVENMLVRFWWLFLCVCDSFVLFCFVYKKQNKKITMDRGSCNLCVCVCVCVCVIAISPHLLTRSLSSLDRL